MSAPSTDKAGIRQIIRALVAADITLLSVDIGDGEEAVTSEAQALDECTAGDEAWLVVRLADGDTTGWIRFVLGNDPEEVVCDHTVNLSPVIDPVTEKWWN